MSTAATARLRYLFAALLIASATDASASSFAIDVAAVGGPALHLTPALNAISPGVFTTSDHVTGTSFFDLSWNLQLEGDPAISGSFTLRNLSALTQTFTVSATLGVLPIPGPTLIGGFFGDLVYTDLNGDGLVRVIASPFYQAQIDSAGVQNLGVLNLGPLSGVEPKQSFGVPIPSAPGPGVATSIGVAFPGFSLTAGDQVQVPFEFVVAIPEPASGSLLAMGLVGLWIVLRMDGSRGRVRRG